MFNIDYRFIQCFPMSFQSWHASNLWNKLLLPTQGRVNLLQSLAPTLIKLTYLWFSYDLGDSD